MPSRRLPWPQLRNDWAAYQFDQAVMYAGLTLEHASQEREEFGPENARESRDKYTMAQLLEPNFRLPQPGKMEGATRGIKEMAAAMPESVGHFKQVAPANAKGNT